MNNDLDALLQTDYLDPPDDFTQRVMQRIQLRRYATPSTSIVAAERTGRWNRLRWLAAATGLVGGGLLGLSQLASFVFGLWLAGSAV